MFSRNTVPGESRTLTLAQACSIIKEVATVTSIWRDTTKAAGGRRRDRPDGKCLRARRPQARTGPMTTTCFQSLVPTAERAGTGTNVDLSVDVQAPTSPHPPDSRAFARFGGNAGTGLSVACCSMAGARRSGCPTRVSRFPGGGCCSRRAPTCGKAVRPWCDRPRLRALSVMERVRSRNRQGRIASPPSGGAGGQRGGARRAPNHTRPWRLGGCWSGKVCGRCAKSRV